MTRRPADDAAEGDGSLDDGRRVRLREDGETPRESQRQEAEVRSTSPLITVLEQGIPQRVVKDPTGRVYTGFLWYGHVASSHVRFEPMSSNRAINEEVVASRVRSNLENFGRHGEYCDFGQIVMVVVKNDPAHNFYVMDGQHRCRTMHELHQQRPERDIVFQFRAKIVDTEADAYNELKLFQEIYPSDPRSFFGTRAERELATSVLAQLKVLFPHSDLFKPVQQSSRHGQRIGDPNRPYLNDNIVFWLLVDSGLLSGQAASSASVTKQLQDMNSVMASVAADDLPRLGKNTTAKMVTVAQRMSCFLGFFREGTLSWGDLAPKLLESQSEGPRS